MAYTISEGKQIKAQKVVVSGVEGIGKTTFCSRFPDPVFIDTEGGTANMDVKRITPAPTSAAMLTEQIKAVRDGLIPCKTLVLDTADWAETLLVNSVLEKNKKNGIEDFGYGKGYTYVGEEFGKVLNLLQEVIDRGVNVAITAHVRLRKFELPEELGAYDKYELKLSKQSAPMLKEWADIVLFANYEINVINVDGMGAAKGKNKAQGTKRVMFSEHHPCWDAKNRHNLPNKMPFEFSQIEHIFPNAVITANKTISEDFTSNQANTHDDVNASADGKPTPSSAMSDIDPRLRDLMAANNISPEELSYMAYSKGHFPKDTPIENFDREYVGWILSVWDKIVEFIKETRALNNLPF